MHIWWEHIVGTELSPAQAFPHSLALHLCPPRIATWNIPMAQSWSYKTCCGWFLLAEPLLQQHTSWLTKRSLKEIGVKHSAACASTSKEQTSQWRDPAACGSAPVPVQGPETSLGSLWHGKVPIAVPSFPWAWACTYSSLLWARTTRFRSRNTGKHHKQGCWADLPLQGLPLALPSPGAVERSADTQPLSFSWGSICFPVPNFLLHLHVCP